jgi:hypothetical protein
VKYLLLLIVFLLSTYVSANPCGLEGSIAERIKNCNHAKGKFVLVVRSDKGQEIYQDQQTGLLWGDRIATDFNHFGSQKACSHELAESQLLKEVRWRLPSIREFQVAAGHGIKDSLPRMFYSFWTSTPVKTKVRRKRGPPAQAYLWDGSEEKTDTGDLKDGASVRCVGAPH